MDHNELAARIASTGCDIKLDKYPRHGFGSTVIDFRIKSFDDWPDFFNTDLERSERPSFISSSSINVKSDGEYSISHLDDSPEEIAEFEEAVGMPVEEAVGDVYVDEAVLHLPPYRTDQKKSIEDHFDLADEWTIVWGQRIGFGPVEPDWGITPHIYYSGDGSEISEALRVVRQAVSFVEDVPPMTGGEIADILK